MNVSVGYISPRNEVAEQKVAELVGLQLNKAEPRLSEFCPGWNGIRLDANTATEKTHNTAGCDV